MIRSLGKFTVAVAGQLTRVTNSAPDFQNDARVHGILIQALPDNVGRVYIGASDMSRAARTGLYGMLATPTANILPTFAAALTISPNALKFTDFYIDADNANDGVIVCVLIA